MRRAETGFALLEVVVALAVAAVLVAAIGEVAAVGLAGARTAGERAALAQAARQVLANLSLRRDLAPGVLAGSSLGIAWRVELSARPAQGPPGPDGWVALDLAARVTAPSGRSLQVDTVRLARRSAP